MAGHSIPAAEHSTITTWQQKGELEAFRNMLTSFPTGLVAVVSDSYDIYNAVSNYWGKELKAQILGRQGTLVIRPDSGDPKTMVVEVLTRLAAAFADQITTNSKGFKVLPPQLRVIQGDGISYETVQEILDGMKDAGWSADNVVFGSGGALLQVQAAHCPPVPVERCFEQTARDKDYILTHSRFKLASNFSH